MKGAVGAGSSATARRRWPRRVYGVGVEPDPRFTFANERTLLAWIRTSLALLATGVAIEALVPAHQELARSTIGGAFIGLAALISVGAFLRWMTAERALRRGQALPALGLATLLAVGVPVLAALSLAFLVLP